MKYRGQGWKGVEVQPLKVSALPGMVSPRRFQLMPNYPKTPVDGQHIVNELDDRNMLFDWSRLATGDELITNKNNPGNYARFEIDPAQDGPCVDAS